MAEMILGLDTGTRHCGYAVLSSEGDLIESGVWHLHGRAVPARLYDLRRWLLDLHKRYPKIVWCGIESPYVRFPKAAIRLGQAGGLAMSCAFEHGARVVEIAPKEAKKAISRSGEATKHGVQEAVKERFGMEDPQEDQADAIAVAWAVFLQLKEEG